MRLLVSLVLAAGPACAEPPLTAEEFEALTLGRTMTWAEFGTVYGVEQYLPDRKVRWTFLGDDCKTGIWYPEGAAICFLYEDKPDPVCWDISATETGFSARSASRGPDAPPVTVEDTAEPLACFGPKVGV